MLIAARQSMLTGKKQPEEKWWLCFTAEQAGSTIQMEHYGSNAPSISLETSIDDGASWQSFRVDSTKITLSNIGDKVYFRASPSGNQAICIDPNQENNFIMSGKINCTGSLHSLLNPIKPPDIIPAFCYANLFYNCDSLTSAVVPDAKRFEQKCYNLMFNACDNISSLTCYFKSFIDYSGTINTLSWLNNVKSRTGTFYCYSELGTQQTIERDVSHCPNNWTVVNI